ncbi:MAG: PliI family lysozyme inhibitor of I-type lysozyme [Phenylobacterium sp.]
MLRATLAAALLATATPAFAADVNRIVLNGSDEGLAVTAVADEGEGEPRSTGSYALRLYKSGDPSYPFDAFVAGAVRARDGTLEALKFADINRDGKNEIIVVIRSAGTGGYLSADAFRVQKGVPVLVGSKSGLASNADPVAELSGGRKGQR